MDSCMPKPRNKTFFCCCRFVVLIFIICVWWCLFNIIIHVRNNGDFKGKKFISQVTRFLFLCITDDRNNSCLEFSIITIVIDCMGFTPKFTTPIAGTVMDGMVRYFVSSVTCHHEIKILVEMTKRSIVSDIENTNISPGNKTNKNY